MHGNVWEFCSGWYSNELVGGTDPSGPTSAAIVFTEAGVGSSMQPVVGQAFGFRVGQLIAIFRLDSVSF